MQRFDHGILSAGIARVRSHEKCRSLTKAVGESHESVGVSLDVSEERRVDQPRWVPDIVCP